MLFPIGIVSHVALSSILLAMIVELPGSNVMVEPQGQLIVLHPSRVAAYGFEWNMGIVASKIIVAEKATMPKIQGYKNRK